MAAAAAASVVVSTPFGRGFSVSTKNANNLLLAFAHSKTGRLAVSASKTPFFPTATAALTSHRPILSSYSPVEASSDGRPAMPASLTPREPLDLYGLLFRNRIIFIGEEITSEVAQRVMSQLMTLATIDEDADITIYINSPEGNVFDVLAIYDCMSWIKPKVGTVCFGSVASMAVLLLAGGEKGMRYAMPNARIMLNQPYGECAGHVDDVKIEIREAVAIRDKLDKMYVAFTGQPLKSVQLNTERNRFFSAAEAMEFGLVDSLVETEY